MTLDYTNEPFYKDIENGTLENLNLASEDDIQDYSLCMGWLNQIWGHAAQRIRKNICLPSRTYLEAVKMSTPSFARLLQEQMDVEHLGHRSFEDTMNPEPLTEAEAKAEDVYLSMVGNSWGCYLIGKGSPILLVYGVHVADEEMCSYAFHMYVVRGRMLCCYVQVGEDYSYMCSNHPLFVDIAATSYGSIPVDGKSVLSQISFERDMTILFEKYAKVENRIVMPKTRFRADLKAMKMDENHTRLKVQLRDSTYFTNIIRKGDFMVRGHLRLANVKENGEWTKRLIWISSYTKHQYVRRAKITQ